jgi:dihydroneopterin aldolase
MDKIFITELRADAIIGINDWERKVKQRVTVDLEIATDISKAAASDDIQFALNYKTISDRLVGFIEASEFELVETLIEGIATIVTDEFSVPWVKVTLHKPGALSATKDVGLIIERGARA